MRVRKRIEDLTFSEVAEGGAGVFQIHGVGGVCGGEGIAGSDGGLHEKLAIFAS